MSWSIKSIGPRAAVRAEVLAQVHMPAGIKAAILEILDEPTQRVYGQRAGMPPQYNDHACVQGHGHSGGGAAGNAKLNVELISMAVSPPEGAITSPAPVGDGIAIARPV